MIVPEAVRSAPVAPGLGANESSQSLHEIVSLIERHAQAPIGTCALERVTLVRVEEPQTARQEFFVPVVCVVVQGAKTIQLKTHHLRFEAGTCVASAQDFPITGRVVTTPYRAAALHLNPAVLAELLFAMPTTEDPGPPEFAVGRAPADLIESLVRFLRLLDHPEDRAVLAEAAEREVLYRALCSPLGPVIRRFALEGHMVSRVQPAIAWIRAHAAEKLSVEELAARCHLSTSSLYRSFRAATGNTPLQFQKQIRLQEARQSLLLGEGNASSVATRVGYASAAQFNREYRRLFGTTPGQDAVGRTPRAS